MRDKLFAELVESVQEGAAILQGKQAPSRQFQEIELNVKAIRERYALSQSEFAVLLGVSIKTLQNWEQGPRYPRGPARLLLQVATKHPEAVWDVSQVKLAA